MCEHLKKKKGTLFQMIKKKKNKQVMMWLYIYTSDSKVNGAHPADVLWHFIQGGSHSWSRKKCTIYSEDHWINKIQYSQAWLFFFFKGQKLTGDGSPQWLATLGWRGLTRTRRDSPSRRPWPGDFTAGPVDEVGLLPIWPVDKEQRLAFS